MEGNKERNGMLDLMIRPGFSVRDGILEHVNPAAQGLLLSPGTAISELLATGEEEYAAFTEGCLYLKLKLGSGSCGACVSRVEDADIFVLDQEPDGQLQALALAAMELRTPLMNTMLSADHLPESPETREYLARLNRGLYQLHRIINNMSDAGRFASETHLELRDPGMVFGEIFEKAQCLLAHAGVTLTYQGLKEQLVTLLDREQLERAVLNMLSNAVKFSPEGSTLNATLSRTGKLLRLSILDSGCGIPENILPNVYSRYLRQPALEDPRSGLGLGMVLLRSAAANHGGTVLIDRPGKTGTRVTMTIQLRQGERTGLRTPIDLPSGLDPGLLELSDCLPASVYEK